MYSMDNKYGKLKRQINRYFLPMEISPQIIIDALRGDAAKTGSPTKAKQEALNRLSEETKRIELLKITGRELNSNFMPMRLRTPKTHTIAKDNKLSPNKLDAKKYNIQEIVSLPMGNLIAKLKEDPELQQFSNELDKIRQLCENLTNSPEGQLPAISPEKRAQSLEKVQCIILRNPTLYRKLIFTYQKQKLLGERQQSDKLTLDRKKPHLSEGLISRKMTGTSRKFQANFDKNFTPAELKKCNNYINYREFLLTINLSNGVIINPEPEVQYKAYVCKGNNGLLVKNLVKSRPWWCLRSISDVDNCTLVWTEWKKGKMTAALSTHSQDLSSSISNFPSFSLQTEKSSFYLSNHYERMNNNSMASLLDDERQKSQVRSSSISIQSTRAPANRIRFNTSHTAASNKFEVAPIQALVTENNFFGNALSMKMQHILKLIPLAKLSIHKYVNTEIGAGCDQGYEGYYTFTKKINEKKFEETSRRQLPTEASYSIYNSFPRSRDSKPVMRVLNHLPGCLQLHSKKLLYLNMKKYYEARNKNVQDFLPETYLITKGLEDPNLAIFEKQFGIYQSERLEDEKEGKRGIKNIWICKPGENSNRGNGISVVKSLEQIRNLLRAKSTGNRSMIIQKYMENPYLYNKRKFDIRVFVLFTCVNGNLKGYWYQDGYLRTTSKQYSLKNIDNKFVHLTNDAIQKKGEEYGKFQNFNKVTYLDFEKYIDANEPQDSGKFLQARKRMKEITKQLMEAVSRKLNPNKKQFCFELFGLDYMLDAKMNPFLIQANSNPCLDTQGSVLSKIISHLIQNTIRVAIDPLFPPPYSQNWKTSRFSPGNPFEHNKFELIHQSGDEGQEEEERQVLEEEEEDMSECENEDE